MEVLLIISPLPALLLKATELCGNWGKPHLRNTAGGGGSLEGAWCSGIHEALRKFYEGWAVLGVCACVLLQGL